MGPPASPGQLLAQVNWQENELDSLRRENTQLRLKLALAESLMMPAEELSWKFALKLYP